MNDNDKFFVNLVHHGYLSVTVDGRVFNNKTNRSIGALGSGKYYKISVKDPESKKIRHMQVHRLVYAIHKNDIPSDMQINHKDGNKHNNHIDNLEVVTHGENVRHAISTGLSVPLKGGEKINAKFRGWFT